MMRALWPESGNYDFSDETVFVWQRAHGGLGGFASVSLRPWADEGCDSSGPQVNRSALIGDGNCRSDSEWTVGSGLVAK